MKIKYMFMLPVIAGMLQTHAQQGPTKNNPVSPLLNGTNAGNFWSRAGNTLLGGTNNIFGTMWNSPIYTVTNGINRTRLNGNLITPIFGVNQNVSGYFGISPQGFFANNSPWAMLHLDGPNNTPFLGDWRRWMRTGVYMRENSDAMYVGLKEEHGSNRSDAVINWSDDAQPGAGGGIDKLRFIFTSSASNGNGIGTDPRSGQSLEGYEYMRMQAFPGITNSAGFPVGHVGIGPMFNNFQYPQNRLHMNAEDNLANFLQISNQNGTGATANDGLHIGYPNTAATFLTAHINQKENDNMLMFTNGGERVRISHIGNVSVPNMNPGNVPNNITRVAISHNPATPVTRPLALLHLGYNTGSILNPTTTDGWRSWMDVGTFISQGTDNMYIGLKNENGVLGDRQDAVISFGDNYTNVLPGFNIAPDKLRIIFTSPAAGQPFPGPGAMSTQNGLEFVRYVPFHNTSLGVNDPRTGFGDFESLTPVGTINPGNTIEINSIMNGYNANADTSVTGSYLGSTGASGLRFRDLTSNSNIVSDSVAKLVGIDVDKVLSVDSLGNVVLIRNGAGGGADIGNYCSDSIKKPLTDDYEIPLNQHNYYFSGTNSTKNRVAVGYPCGIVLPSKFNVYLDKTLTSSSSIGNNAGYFLNANSSSGGFDIGVKGEITASINDNSAGYFISTSNAPTAGNVGVTGRAFNSGVSNTGGRFEAKFGGTAMGIIASANGATNNYGVYASAPTNGDTIPGPNYAGYFNGDLVYTGSFGLASDVNLKTNIDTLPNALPIIKQLKPKQFNFNQANYPSMSLAGGLQYGLIAQDVETVLPNLVNNNVHPAKLDSVGNVVVPPVNFKSVEYEQLIPFLIKAMQEQQAKIDSLTTKLNSKDSIQDARLAALEAAIATCCSNNSAKTANNTGSSVLNQMDVELSDKDAIVLNQNVPNPFAEQTTITYNVPSSVGKAQLLFYNSAGQIIQTVDIKTRGKGKVNVFAADLSSGMYHYTLVADGQVVDSKKMVRE